MHILRDIDFWLKAGPTLAALIVPFLTYYLVGKRMERYKADISKELEIHKLQLQSAFQTRFYEFQTRYSWLHKSRAEAIEKLYALVARVHTDLKRWAAPGDSGLTKPADEFIYDAVDHLTEMTDFFDQKRIFFDDKEVASRVVNMIYNTTTIYSQQPQREIADEMIRQYITPVMVELRGEFQKLLEAETPIPAVEGPDGGPKTKG